MNNLTQPLVHRILVVDDNPSIHEDFHKILCPVQTEARSTVASLASELFEDASPENAWGSFQLDSAHQGQEALAMVQAAQRDGRPYSLAFIDVRMPPGWDGIETIARIWQTDPDLQVVVCTAYSDHSWQIGRAHV